MTWLTGEIHTTGWTVSNYPGWGILGENVPSDGDNGASVIYNDSPITGREYRLDWITPFSAGDVTYYEDGSLTIENLPDGEHTATYRLYEDNVDQGTALVTITVSSVVPITASISFSEPAPAFSGTGSVTLPAGPIVATVNFTSPMANFSAVANITRPPYNSKNIIRVRPNQTIIRVR